MRTLLLNRKFKSDTRLALAGLLFFFSGQGPAHAVVGQAEQYDFFEQRNLDDFHDNLVNEERTRMVTADNMKNQLLQRSLEMNDATGENKEALDAEIQDLKRQLLTLPKRDRLKFELEGSQVFDTNVNRHTFGYEKNDSTFKAGGNMLIDLSGRKTDLRLETGVDKQWNIEYPEKDTIEGQEVLRYRRKYFRKISQTTQSRFARHNSKTVEIDSEKVRYDSAQNTVFNYAFSPKLSLNTDLNMTHHIFPQEAFDQDSSKEVSFAPSGFWNFTPKSRASLGYRLAGNRIESKTGDANSHEIHGGYFGAITKKSSASLDLAFAHQMPKSRDTATVNTVTTGLGYIWQMTPKTQLLVQYINSMQNSTSNVAPAAGEDAAATIDAGAEDQATVGKSDSRFHNNSVSLSLNSRLTRKLSAVLTINPNYLTTSTASDVEVAEGQEEPDTGTKQYGSSFSISFTYTIKRWMVLTSGYSFNYRWGDERADKNRAHLWKNALRLIF